MSAKAIGRMCDEIGGSLVLVERDTGVGWSATLRTCGGYMLVRDQLGSVGKRAATNNLYAQLRAAAIALLSDEFDFEGEG